MLILFMKSPPETRRVRRKWHIVPKIITKGEKTMLTINELKEKMANDQEFLNKLVEASDSAYSLVKEAGYDVSEDEWNKLCDEVSGDDEGELSLDDLDSVAGGFGAFSKIPRVPLNKIDKNLKNKI